MAGVKTFSGMGSGIKLLGNIVGDFLQEIKTIKKNDKIIFCRKIILHIISD